MKRNLEGFIWGIRFQHITINFSLHNAVNRLAVSPNYTTRTQLHESNNDSHLIVLARVRSGTNVDSTDLSVNYSTRYQLNDLF